MSQSLERALRLLDEVSAGDRSLDELAETLAVHKSTVLRLLQTLERGRYVRHDAEHRYSLGLRVFELASTSLEQRDVVASARPILTALNGSTGHTVHLAVRDGDSIVYVDKHESRAGLRMYSRVGLRAPLHCTAVGKVLLANSVDREKAVESLTLDAFTDRTIIDRDDLSGALDDVVRAGWASDRGEHEPFMNCIAIPIRNGLGQVVAAASISVPDVVQPWEKVHALLPELRQAGEAISQELGAPPRLERSAPR